MKEIFKRGIDSIIEQGADDFRAHLEQSGMASADLERARAALVSIPDTLSAFNRATHDEDAPIALRALFPALVSYLLSEDDLLPSRGDQLVLGLLDDAYLVHSACLQVIGTLPNGNSLAPQEHLRFLTEVVPADVREKLDGVVEEVITEATSQAEQLGL